MESEERFQDSLSSLLSVVWVLGVNSGGNIVYVLIHLVGPMTIFIFTYLFVLLWWF